VVYSTEFFLCKKQVISEGAGVLLFNMPHLFCSLLLCETHRILGKNKNENFLPGLYAG